MSVDLSDGERADVQRSGWRRARKEHRCIACKETIHRGHRYFYEFFVWDGSPETIKRCARCEALYEHLWTLVSDDTGVADALDCGHTYESMHGEVPPEIARLAFLTQDEAQELAK